jgi:hypothetical protein
MCVFFLVTILIPSGIALAEMPPLKRDDFEAVWVGQSVDKKCPFTEDDVQRVWEGELLRARLKFEGSPSKGIMWFSSSSLLDPSRDGRWVYDHELQWTWPDPSGKWPMIILESNLGIGGKEHLQTIMEKTIEVGITRYLKANLE